MVGSDPVAFRAAASQAKLPQERQESCRGDYEQAQASWLQLLEPHLRSALPKPSFLDRLLKRPAPVAGPPETRIDVNYGAASGDLAPFRDMLKTVGLLEIVRDFVVRNFTLPRSVTFEAKTCGEPNAWWDPGARRLTICYEIIQDYVSLGLTK
jgi:Putative metallopeptidase